MTRDSISSGDSPPPTTSGTTAQAAFRRGGRNRLIGAGMVALLALILLVVLGPTQEEVRRRFEYYGAPGEMKIMPEISIVDRADTRHQLPKTLQTPPPPSRIDIEDMPESENAEMPKPKDTPIRDRQPVDMPSLKPNPDSDVVERNQVELALPQQTNPDWFILEQYLPEYPFDAPQNEQRIPIVQVKVAIFVDPEGKISEAMITSASAGSAFTNEVLEKVRRWRFGWRVDPKAGRWIELTFNFNSPYL